MDAMSVLLWYGLDDVRKGILHARAPMEHREVIREEDTLIFACMERPEKYDRVLWWDSDDGLWREHYVCKVESTDDGHKVTCESALFETRLDFLEGFRLENASYYEVLSKVVPYTRFAAGTHGSGGVNQGTAWITRKSVLEGIRKIEDIFNVEFYTTIDVDEERGRVGERALSFCAEQGTWRGLRFTRDRNLHAGHLVVEADEVVTALYGYGSSFGAYDEDGNATGGFTRRLTFGSVNGGVDYIEDTRAKERYGRVNADGTRRNNFAHVIFDDVEKPDPLYRKTHDMLQTLTSPRVTYVIDEDIDMDGRHVGLGDVALICDEQDGVPHRCGMRVTRRVRTFGEEMTCSIRLGEITAGTRSHFAAYERRCGTIASFEDALVKAGLKDPPQVEVPDTALSLELKLRSAKRADGGSIDLRYSFAMETDDVYRYDVTVRNNLAYPIGNVSVAIPAAGVSESYVYLAAGAEKLYTCEVSPDEAAVAAGVFTCTATTGCPAGNIGLASEYAACSLSKSHTLPESSVAKPVSTIPDDLTGDGTFENPYTVTDIRRCVCVSTDESALEDVWVSGYVVGWADMDVSSGLSASTLHLGSADAVASNIVLADSASETDVAKMTPVNLSTATRRRKTVRMALNLADNPQMVGMRVWAQGDVLRYGRVSGMKRTDEYRFCDGLGKWHGWWTIDGSLGESL